MKTLSLRNTFELDKKLFVSGFFDFCKLRPVYSLEIIDIEDPLICIGSHGRIIFVRMKNGSVFQTLHGLVNWDITSMIFFKKKNILVTEYQTNILIIRIDFRKKKFRFKRRCHEQKVIHNGRQTMIKLGEQFCMFLSWNKRFSIYDVFNRRYKDKCFLPDYGDCLTSSSDSKFVFIGCHTKLFRLNWKDEYPRKYKSIEFVGHLLKSKIYVIQINGDSLFVGRVDGSVCMWEKIFDDDKPGVYLRTVVNTEIPKPKYNMSFLVGNKNILYFSKNKGDINMIEKEEETYISEMDFSIAGRFNKLMIWDDKVKKRELIEVRVKLGANQMDIVEVKILVFKNLKSEWERDDGFVKQDLRERLDFLLDFGNRFLVKNFFKIKLFNITLEVYKPNLLL